MFILVRAGGERRLCLMWKSQGLESNKQHRRRGGAGSVFGIRKNMLDSTVCWDIWVGMFGVHVSKDCLYGVPPGLFGVIISSPTVFGELELSVSDTSRVILFRRCWVIFFCFCFHLCWERKAKKGIKVFIRCLFLLSLEGGGYVLPVARLFVSFGLLFG